MRQTASETFRYFIFALCKMEKSPLSELAQYDDIRRCINVLMDGGTEEGTFCTSFFRFFNLLIECNG